MIKLIDDVLVFLALLTVAVLAVSYEQELIDFLRGLQWPINGFWC